MEFRAPGSPEDMPLMATQPKTVSLSLPPVPESARRARRALVQGGLDPDLDHTVSLLATELVTNSVRHVEGPGDVRLEATLTDGFARVEVTDTGPGFDPEVRNEVNGFGLRLVDKLASRWGVERADDATTVWFEVDRRRRRFDRDDMV
jgi:anti-sigma regulatory factor (Ser/Thr protein kinase)